MELTKIVHFENTQYGFIYGGATVERLCSDVDKGWVVMSLVTKKYPANVLQIYVTKTGKIRIFVRNKELKIPKVKT